MIVALAAAFLATILGANYLTTEYGMVPVGLGLTATAGTYLAGCAFVLRDSIQDRAGATWTMVLIGAGGLLSIAVADPAIAVASGIAFMHSEFVDLAIYTPLRRRGYLRAAIASNVAGSFVDTVLFLWLAGFFAWPDVPGQMLAKVTVTAAVAAAVGGARALLREPVNPDGA